MRAKHLNFFITTWVFLLIQCPAQFLTLHDSASPDTLEGCEGPAPDPYQYYELDEEPRPLNLDEIKKMIRYPELLAESGINGNVVLRVLVNENGDYCRHIILKDPHPLLTREMERVTTQMRFLPAKMDGRNVKAWVTIPFTICLSKN